MNMAMTVNGVEVNIGTLPRDTRGRLAFDFIAFAATHSIDAQAVVDLALASADGVMERFGVENTGENDRTLRAEAQLASVAMSVLGFDDKGNPIPFDEAAVSEAVARTARAEAENTRLRELLQQVKDDVPDLPYPVAGRIDVALCPDAKGGGA